MTYQTFIFNLILLLISLSVPIVTTYVVAFLRARLGNENLKKYYNIVDMAVKAAEETYKLSGQGQGKKADVKEYLFGKLGTYLSMEDIDKLIQATVFEMNKASKTIFNDVFNPITVPLGTSHVTTSNDTPIFAKDYFAAPDISSPKK